MIEKYRKKPIVIEAIEITGPEVFPEIEKWMNGWALKYPTEKVKVRESSKGKYNCYLSNDCIFRNSFEIGDFIVKGVDGSIYPVLKESFWKVYEKTESKELTW
jgi:hypothetical protein